MALIGEIVRRLFAHPAIVALVPATFLGSSMLGPVQFGHPAFRRIACRPILPAAVPAVVCPSPGSIDFAPADFVVAGSAAIVVATDFAWTVVVAFDSVVTAGSADSAGSVGFVVVAAGFVV